MPPVLRSLVLMALGACGLFSVTAVPAANAADPVRCTAFTQDKLADPEPRENAVVKRRFEEINDAVKQHSYPVVFLGDSLTQRWDEVAADHQIWEQNFQRFDPLNAGINGDRTEHLLWRIEHGNLDNQRPQLAVLLIGTNDLGHGRSPEDAAEGVRQVLIKLRQMLPATRILLQGLWPRADLQRLSSEIGPVNDRISQCNDNTWVVYRDLGRSLLDSEGRLTRATAPDGLHPSPAGYAKISPIIAQQVQALLAAR